MEIIYKLTTLSNNFSKKIKKISPPPHPAAAGAGIYANFLAKPPPLL